MHHILCYTSYILCHIIICVCTHAPSATRRCLPIRAHTCTYMHIHVHAYTHSMNVPNLGRKVIVAGKRKMVAPAVDAAPAVT